MKKTLLLIGTLALAGLASAKTFDNMVISTNATAAGHQMSAGEYVVQLKGSTAIITNIVTGKSFRTDVKVENAAQKFENTAMKAESKDGAWQITSIDLGGSSTVIEFGE